MLRFWSGGARHGLAGFQPSSIDGFMGIVGPCGFSIVAPHLAHLGGGNGPTIWSAVYSSTGPPQMEHVPITRLSLIAPPWGQRQGVSLFHLAKPFPHRGELVIPLGQLLA